VREDKFSVALLAPSACLFPSPAFAQVPHRFRVAVAPGHLSHLSHLSHPSHPSRPVSLRLLNALDILLPTVGSAGDVHPIVALGLALQARGHRATIITNPLFQELIEAQGLGFLPIGTLDGARAAIADPDLWHPRKGFEVVARRAMLPAMVEIYRHIERQAGSRTVVAASGIAFGARIAQERLGVPTATVHLQPSIIRSLVDHGMAGNVRISASQPMWFKRAFFRLADWLLIDRVLKAPVNDFRATLHLPPVDRVMYRWLHSPQLVIGFFPDWFAPSQPDWPPETHLVGFPLWDSGNRGTIAPDAEEFLHAGEPPIIFTPGSAGATMHRYFRESVTAAGDLGIRAMLVTNYLDQVPRDLPRHVKAFGYLPFSQVLSRARLLVYHGGIGTLAQTIKAGIPHLVVPNGHDQFDNGFRIQRLGLGRAIPQTRYHARAVVSAIRAILGDQEVHARCREYSRRIDSAAALSRASELIESLAARSGIPVSNPAVLDAGTPGRRAL
jgi:rhamnosyltransferase subunit B